MTYEITFRRGTPTKQVIRNVHAVDYRKGMFYFSNGEDTFVYTVDEVEYFECIGRE